MAISLDKKTEVAQGAMISLMKEGVAQGLNVDDITARVVLVMDHSGSMSGLYNRGDVQEVADKVLAASLAGLDDDGDIQVHFFDSRAHKAEEVNVSNYQGFVDQWHRAHNMGATEYLAAIDAVVASLQGGGGFLRKKKAVDSSIPTLVFFVTDGDPSDNESRIAQRLKDLSDQPIFWQFIPIRGHVPFLDTLDNQTGGRVDNVGVSKIQANNEDDQKWFTENLREFILKWTPAARAQGIIA